MSIFSARHAAKDPPVRRDKVLAVMAAYMRESDAGDGPDLGAAAWRLTLACRDATQAEIRAGLAAAKRNGY